MASSLVLTRIIVCAVACAIAITSRPTTGQSLYISHLNINSLRHKFHDLSDLFSDRLVDIIFISETKLDSTFTQHNLMLLVIFPLEKIDLVTEAAF